MFRSKQAAPVSEHAKLRSRQIMEFVKLNPTAQCVANGLGVADTTTTYTLQLQGQSAGPLTLHILLGPLFPERPPACQLTTHNSSLRLQHKYLDANGYLSLHPKLQPTQWSPHVNLGLMIQDLVRELTQQPPLLIGGAMPAFSSATPSAFMAEKNAAAAAAAGYAYPGAQQPPQQYQQSHLQHGQQQLQAHDSSPGSYMAVTSPHSHNSPHHQHQSSQPPIPRRPSLSGSSSSAASASPAPLSGSQSRTRPPDVPASFPQLDALSIIQLEDILGDPHAVRDLAAEMEVIVAMEAAQQSMLEKIEAGAKANLQKKEQMQSLEAQLTTESARLREAQQLLASLLQRHQATQSKYALGSLLSQLDAAITSAEEESDVQKGRYEEINAKTAAGGSAEDQQALEQYIKQRMTFHERAAKKERIVETYGRH